jgi:hypothetical protein
MRRCWRQLPFDRHVLAASAVRLLVGPALEHQLLPDFVTTVVLFSTLASAVTLTAVLAFV